jgi:hypothetical protein
MSVIRDRGPWEDLSARYRYDEDAQFLVFVEQFAEARRLLDPHSIAHLRMALVAFDNLAEVLLARRIRALYRYAEDPLLAPVRRFDHRERTKLNDDFGARVMVAQWEPLEGSPLSHHLESLLDDLDAETFRVGHAYRRRAYHADEHNEAVLELVARAYLLAIGRAFVRIQPKNSGSSMRHRLNRLKDFGYEPSSESRLPGYFVPAEAAEAVIAHVTGGLSVRVTEARSRLIADLEQRADWADAIVAELEAEGYDRHRVADTIPLVEFGELHGDDEILVQFDRAYDHARWSAFRDHEDEARFAERMTEADAALEGRNKRFQELYASFQAKRASGRRARRPDPLDLGEIDRLRRLGRRLSSARTLAALHERYRKLDEGMEKLERALDEIAIGWARQIREEEDRIREEGW